MESVFDGCCSEVGRQLPPSFRLDCQVADFMEGSQLAVACRLRHFDAEIASLNDIMDVTISLRRTYDPWVATSWAAYNQVLLETADRVFEAHTSGQM